MADDILNQNVLAPPIAEIPLEPAVVTEQDQIEALQGQDFINQELTPDLAAPVEAPPVEEPTPISAADPQASFEQIRKEIQTTRVSNFGPGAEVSDAEVLDEMDTRKAEADLEETSKIEGLKQKLAVRKALLERAAAQGVTLAEDPELDPMLRQVDETVSASMDASPEQIEEATTPSVADVEAASEPIRAEKAKRIAADQEQRKKEVEVKAKVQSIGSDLEQGAEEAKDKIDKGLLGPKINWQSAIGILLGGVSMGVLGLKENPVWKSMQTQFDNDLKKRKLSLDEKFKANSANLKALDSQIKIRSAGEKSAKHKLDMQKLRGQIAKSQSDLNLQL